MTRAHELHTGLYQEIGKIGEELSLRARARLSCVKLFIKLRGRGFASREACDIVGISRPTLYRWVKKFQDYGPYSLEPNSTRPRNMRVKKWHKTVQQTILDLRRKFPAWGKSKIFIIMKRKGFTVSESTVGRILHYLIEKGKCHGASIFRKNGKARRSVTRWHAVRIRERLQPKLPGEVIQVDSMTVNLTGFGFKQFTATCPISKWTFLGVSKLSKFKHI
jgi:transposase